MVGMGILRGLWGMVGGDACHPAAVLWRHGLRFEMPFCAAWVGERLGTGCLLQPRRRRHARVGIPLLLTLLRWLHCSAEEQQKTARRGAGTASRISSPERFTSGHFFNAAAARRAGLAVREPHPAGARGWGGRDGGMPREGVAPLGGSFSGKSTGTARPSFESW